MLTQIGDTDLLIRLSVWCVCFLKTEFVDDDNSIVVNTTDWEKWLKKKKEQQTPAHTHTQQQQHSTPIFFKSVLFSSPLSQLFCTILNSPSPSPFFCPYGELVLIQKKKIGCKYKKIGRA